MNHRCARRTCHLCQPKKRWRGSTQEIGASLLVWMVCWVGHALPQRRCFHESQRVAYFSSPRVDRTRCGLLHSNACVTHAQAHKHKHTHTHTRTQTQTHTHTHTQTHTHTRARAHTPHAYSTALCYTLSARTLQLISTGVHRPRLCRFARSSRSSF